MSRLALQAAIVEKGVGMVVVSGDVLDQNADTAVPGRPFFPDAPHVRPCEADLDAMAALIEGAQRPLIFGGEGAGRPGTRFWRSRRFFQAPVGFTFRGKDILEADNPFAVGMTGLLGWGGLQHGLNACDLFLMLGTDFPYSDFLPRAAKVIQVDSRAEHLGRRTPLTLGLCGHVRETLDAL